MHTARKHVRAMVITCLAALASLVMVLTTGTAASAAPYTAGSCGTNYGVCSTYPPITSSAAGRLIYTISVSGSGGAGAWRLYNNLTMVRSGTYSGKRTSNIVTGLSANSGSYVLAISGSDGVNTVAWLCNFTTYADGRNGPCLL